MSKKEGNGLTKLISGSREQKIKILSLGEKGKSENILRNNGSGTPYPHGRASSIFMRPSEELGYLFPCTPGK